MTDHEPTGDVTIPVPPFSVQAAATSPTDLRASVNVDEVRRAFQDSLPRDVYRFVREVRTEFLIVDDDSGGLLKVPWSETADGKATFGDPVPVRVEYVEVEDAAVAASGTPLDRLLLFPALADPQRGR